MAGTYDPNNPPLRPGFYSIIRAVVADAVSGGEGSVGCIPINHDWGPEGVPTKITSMAQFDSVFGNTDDDDRLAVLGALSGDGTPTGGASAVWVYRMPITGSAGSSHVLMNTTPAAALTLTSKYRGTKSLQVNYTVRNHPTDATQMQLLIYSGTILVETFSYLKTNLASLAAAVNANTAGGSDYVTAAVTVDGVALTAVSNVSLTGGASGTPASSDYTAAMSNVEGVNFNWITFPNLTDPTILASARTWITNLNANVREAFLITGGGSSDSVTTANTRSALSNTLEFIINFGGPNWVRAADGVVKSTAQLTGYVLGICAAAGVRKAITFARVPGWTLQTRPAGSDVVSAILGGTLYATQDDLGVRIEKGITTLTVDSPDKPVKVYSKILSVRTLMQLDYDMTVLTERFWIGQVKSNPTTQKAYLGALLAYLQEMEQETALYPGSSSVRLDDTQDNTGDTWYPIYNTKLEQDVERVLAVGVVS